MTHSVCYAVLTATFSKMPYARVVLCFSCLIPGPTGHSSAGLLCVVSGDKDFRGIRFPGDDKVKGGAWVQVIEVV